MRKFSISFLHRLTGNHWKKKREYRYVGNPVYCLLVNRARKKIYISFSPLYSIYKRVINDTHTDVIYLWVYPVLVLCMYVFPSVCPEPPGHSFWAKDLKFGTQHSWCLRKKWNFYFFEFLRAFLPPFTPKKSWKMAKKALKTTKRGILSSAQFSR